MHPNRVRAAQCEVGQSLTEQPWNFFKPHGQSRQNSDFDNDSTPTLSISFHKAALWNYYVQFIITFYALGELMRHTAYIYTYNQMDLCVLICRITMTTNVADMS